MKHPFLTGNTVYLRGLERSDLELLKRWISDEKVTHYLETGTFPLSIERLNEDYENELKNQKDISFLVIFKKSDTPIGWGGLYNTDWIKRSSELRFFIGETKHWKLTAALESQKLLLQYAFEKLNLHRVTGGANVENKGSWKVLERIGFVKEGVFRDVVYRNGKYYDAYMYSMLRKEYEKLYLNKTK